MPSNGSAGDRAPTLRRRAGVDAALDDAEQRRSGAAWAARQRSAQRCVRSMAAATSGAGRRRIDELVEHHRDVGAQQLLDLDRALRRQPMRAPVEVARERDAVVVDAAQVGEAEDLEAA